MHDRPFQTRWRVLEGHLDYNRRVQLLLSSHVGMALAVFTMMDCDFLILGDIDGQLLPISAATDRFDYDGIAGSDFMHDLCNGLRIDLTECRRGTGQEHFKFMQGIFDRKWSLKSCIEAAKVHFPRTDEEPHYTLAIPPP